MSTSAPRLRVADPDRPGASPTEDDARGAAMVHRFMQGADATSLAKDRPPGIWGELWLILRATPDVSARPQVVSNFFVSLGTTDADRAAAMRAALERAADGTEGVSSVLSATKPGVHPPEFAGRPRTIVVSLRPVPEFDPSLIPAPFRAWLVDIADRLQCSIEYVAVGAMVALSSVVGRRLGIRPKQYDDWTVIANLWGLIVGRPGAMKTPGLKEALRPLSRLAAKARERHALAVEEFRRDRLVREAYRDAAREALKKRAKGAAGDAELRRFAADAAADIDAGQPTLRRYSTNDTTVPKLNELQRDNPNGLLIFRDELAGFFRSLEKQGCETDKAFYLEGWDGGGSFTSDRIARGTVHVEANCLAILGGIQPGPLAEFVRAATRGADDDGLISRFQLAVFPDQDRPFRIVDRAPDRDAAGRAADIFRAIDELDPRSIGADGDDADRPPFLRFDGSAQAFFYEWLTALETTKLRTGEAPAMESHLAKYRSLMPSLALLFHVLDCVDGAGLCQGPVGLEAATLAARWCDLLEAHARRIYSTAGDGDIQPARTLADRLGGLPTPFTTRDVQRKGWAGLRNPDEIERALSVLADYGWVAARDVPSGPNGGRPTTHYVRHPQIDGEES